MFKDVLDSKKITCYQLAKASGVSYTTINELYRGKRMFGDCSINNGKSLAKGLNMSLAELCKYSEQRINEIPSNLYRCFWDTNPVNLNLVNDKTYIITRLLDIGGYEGLKFVLKAYSYEEIKEVAKKSRNFSPKVASFLKNIYHLQESEMAYYTMNVCDWRK